jgi:hypothetical protein
MIPTFLGWEDELGRLLKDFLSPDGVGDASVVGLIGIRGSSHYELEIIVILVEAGIFSPDAEEEVSHRDYQNRHYTALERNMSRKIRMLFIVGVEQKKKFS